MTGDDRRGRFEHFILLLGRAALAEVFIVAGFGKMFRVAAFASAMAAKGMPFPELFPYLAIVIELVGGLVLLAGFKTRLLSVLFIAYTVFATYLVHDFWTITDGAARAANLVHFNKNCAIIGGLALLFVTGGGAYSLDTLWSRLRGNASVPTRAAVVKS